MVATRLRRLTPGVAVLLLFGCAAAERSETENETESESAAATPRLEAVVPGAPYGRHFHGVHGVTFGPDGFLYAGSVVGQAIYRVDPDDASVELWLGPPLGMADDLEWSPDGETLAWTAFLLGKVLARTGADGEIRELASGLPGANSIAWRDDGRLFATQVFAGDALWELDPAGEREPRRILEGMGGLNGFDFGPDGRLYGPLWERGEVVSVDVDTGEMDVVASGFRIPAAVNFDSRGRLWAVDTMAGEVIRIDPRTGATTVVARTRPSIDNLAFGPGDRLVISNMASNGLYEVDTGSGAVRTLVEQRLSVPAGLAHRDGVLHVADTFAYRRVDATTGEMLAERTMWAQALDELDYPISAFADEERVLLSSFSSGTLQILDRASGETLAMLHGFDAPVAAVRLEDGRLVVLEAAGRVQAVGEEPDAERSVVYEGLIGPAALAVAGGSSIWVTETVAGRLGRLDVDRGSYEVVVEGLTGPEGLDVLPDSRLAVAEVGRRALVAIDPENGERETLADELPIGLPAPAGMPPAWVITGVAADDEGTVYFSSDLESAVYRLRLP